VKGLLAAGADVGKANDDGYTPLHEASERGHTQVVRALISAGADVDKADDYGATPPLAYFSLGSGGGGEGPEVGGGGLVV
jgi:ankyrin repeat protein